MLLLILFGITLLGAWVYWQAPSLDELRPDIEGYLKEKLQLEELRLGNLSWHWAGYLWIHAEQLSFVTKHKHVALKHGELAVRIPMWRMLVGDLMPERLHLSRGKLAISLAKPVGQQSIEVLPAVRILFEDVALHWQYGDSHGAVEHISLNYDGTGHSLDAYFPGTRISLLLDKSMFPDRLDVRFSDLHWLPASLQKHLQGNIAGEISLHQHKQNQWRLKTTLQADGKATIRLDSQRTFSFATIHAAITVHSAQSIPTWQDFAPDVIKLQQLEWTLGNSSASGNGQWQNGILEFDVASSQLAMPIMWSWLKPLGDKDWRTWLASMQSGTATNITASLSLPWSKAWQALPTPDDWQAARYQLNADISGADIALGTSKDALLGSKAHIDVNQDRLHAHVSRTRLPNDIGEAGGDIIIPWNTLELNIAGQADVDAGKLLPWLQAGDTAAWHWKEAATEATFSLRWHPAEAAPRTASAQLRPKMPWDVTIQEIPLRLSQGTVNWNLQKGLYIEGMTVHSPRLHGTITLSASQDKYQRWQLSHLQGQAEGDFADIVSHFQLPIANPAGRFDTSLKYDGRWSGSLDLQHASWGNLLGSRKAADRSYSIRYEGKTSNKYGSPVIHITRIWNQGDMILIGGSGQISKGGLKMQLSKMETAGFRGKIGIQAPFGNTPWEVEVTASYLSRNALPETLLIKQTLMDKPWALRAQLDRFDWGDASMRHVNIQLASRRNSAGIFKAEYIRHGAIDIRDTSAIFSLPGGGLVDLRRVSASVEKQHLMLSATLSPNKEGGMQWRGFAEVEGDFGHIMKRGHVSGRFEGGHMHALFSGKGILLHKQAWWRGLDGRLRLRVNGGRIQAGGTMSRLLAALNISELPKLLTGQREDLQGAGLLYERLQMEATMQDNAVHIHQVAMRSSAMDLAGHGSLDLASNHIDLVAVIRPLQNLDAMLGKIPLLRDMLGGAAHSLVRKVYHLHGPFTNAVVEKIPPEQAGLASPGIIERLFNLPDKWFGKEKAEPLTP